MLGEKGEPTGPGPDPRGLQGHDRRGGLQGRSASVRLEPPQVDRGRPRPAGLSPRWPWRPGAARYGCARRRTPAGRMGGVAAEVFTVEVARGTWPDNGQAPRGPRRGVRTTGHRRAAALRRERAYRRPGAPRRPGVLERRRAWTTTPRRAPRWSRCGRPTRSKAAPPTITQASLRSLPRCRLGPGSPPRVTRWTRLRRAGSRTGKR